MVKAIPGIIHPYILYIERDKQKRVVDTDLNARSISFPNKKSVLLYSIVKYDEVYDVCRPK